MTVLLPWVGVAIIALVGAGVGVVLAWWFVIADRSSARRASPQTEDTRPSDATTDDRDVREPSQEDADIVAAEADTRGSSTVDRSDGSGATAGTPPSEGSDAHDRLERARLALEAGEGERALAFAYGAVKETLAEDTDADRADTPREFYRVCRSDGIDSEYLDVVERVSREYERVVFDPESSTGVDDAVVREAIALVEGDDPVDR